jgi:hypothetical protein
MARVEHPPPARDVLLDVGAPAAVGLALEQRD